MTELLNRMKQRLAEWEVDEPQSDWWQYQREYAEAADTIAAWNKRQPTQRDALREALEAAPLIGHTESVYDFMKRQDAWLKGPYRAAMQEQSK